MQEPTVQVSPAPTPQVAVPGAPPITFTTQQVGGSPRAVYQALRAKREVLGDQMSRLLNRRNNVSERLNSPAVGAAEKVALEQHIQELNVRIIDMEKQLHAADAEVAAAAGVPGAMTSESRNAPGSGPPEEMLIIGTAFTGIAAVILAIAYARRLWRGTTKVVAQIPTAFEARFGRLEQAIDAVAIEIERVSEGQRFLTKVLTDKDPRALGAGAAQPVETRAGAPDPVVRRA